MSQYTSKSKKFNQMVKGEELMEAYAGGYYATATFEDSWDSDGHHCYGAISYHVNDSMPAHKTESFEDLAQFEKAMREFASFRKWSFVKYEE